MHWRRSRIAASFHPRPPFSRANNHQAKFATGLFDVNGDCIAKVAYMTVCPPCYFGNLYMKFGETFYTGYCAFGSGLSFYRTMVRRHYGACPR